MEVFSNILSILAALVVLSILVMVHELGHFGVGRLLGFSIQEFAIGMGPKIFSRKKGETLFSIRALPIGGMCQFYGEDKAAEDTKSFTAQKPWKRFLVILAGPLMNMLFALLFAIVTLSAYGNLVPAVAEAPEETSPAAIAGVKAGDILWAINGDRIEYVSDASEKIRLVEENQLVVTVERDGVKQDILVQNIYNEEAGRNLIGVSITSVRKHFGFFEAIGESFFYVGSMVREMFGFFGGLFKGQVSSGDVMGPVGTISFISAVVRTNFEVILRLSILLSVNLAMINLLPLPALDGGRLVFITIEGIRGKPIKPEREGMVHFIGLMLLFALIIFLTFSDIRALITGGY
ncbi:M50 family metallopeptidase [Eubacteriales bacterium OttesenSCG-928-K08]|nr:M50 family metallopeptidase [Eubacteriales bacterium OttesenSCG-928-K08]